MEAFSSFYKTNDSKRNYARTGRFRVKRKMSFNY